MRAATTSGFGPNSRLVVGETERPVPGPHDVLVQVHVSSVNPKDWKLNKPIASFVPDVAGLRPFIIGDDLSGVVVERGAEVTEFEVGDEVYGMDMRLRTAACAEFAKIATRRIARKPANLSHTEAGVAPLAALTALQGLRKGDLQPGGHVLVIGASGGVGTYAVQIAKALGARVTGVCSTRNLELVNSLGADAVIDYTAGDYRTREEDFDIVFDVTSYESPRSCRKLMKKEGAFISTGGHAGAVLGVLRARLTPGGPKAALIRVESHTRDLDTLRGMFESGRLRSVIDSAYPLSEIDAAYARSRTGHARGKIAIVVRD